MIFFGIKGTYDKIIEELIKRKITNPKLMA
ncbi:hypothetical protein ES707_21546 [subsurface metagenome]